MHGSNYYINRLLAIRSINNVDEKRKAMRRMPLPMGNRGFIRIACWLLGIGQLIIGIIFQFFIV